MFVQQLINGLALGSVYALIALGYTMVYGILQLINFAHGEVYMLGAYPGIIVLGVLTSLGLTASHLPLSLLITVVVSMAFCAAYGAALERIAYRPLRSAAKLSPLISAVGMSIVLQNVVMLAQGKEYKNLPPLMPSEGVSVGGANASPVQIIILGTSLLMMIGLQLFITRTWLGKAMRATDPSTEANRRKLKYGIAGWVLKEGQAVLINDGKEEPRFIKADGLNNNVRSLVCFPVREKDQVVGVFNLSHSKKGAFDEGDKLALAFISNQVGAALTSARFFMELQEINRIKEEFGESSIPREEEMKSSPPPSTFAEVGEIMGRDREIFIYTSEKMHQIKEVIDQVANTDVTVLIQGESGVGKKSWPDAFISILCGRINLL